MSSRVDPTQARSHTEISMLRVLMVLEDYGELMFLQTVLKKLGFDVDAIQNPRSFNDSVLRMNPDLLVMTAFGKRVNGMNLNKNVRRVRGLPRAILLRQPGMVHETAPEVSGWLESPVAAADLLTMIAEVCGLNQQSLHEKFQKLQLREIEKETRMLRPSEDSQPTLEKSEHITGNFQETEEAVLHKGDPNSNGTLPPSTMPSSERSERYKKFLAEQAPEQRGFSVKEVQEKVRDLRREESSTDLADLERERRAFVEHLFKKKA